MATNPRRTAASGRVPPTLRRVIDLTVVPSPSVPSETAYERFNQAAAAYKMSLHGAEGDFPAAAAVAAVYSPYQQSQTRSSSFYSNLHPFTTTATPQTTEKMPPKSDPIDGTAEPAPRANSSYTTKERLAFRADLPKPPPGRLLAGQERLRWAQSIALAGTPVCVQTDFSHLSNPSSVISKSLYKSALAFVNTPPVHVARPAPPPGLPVPNPISYERSITVVGDRERQALPKNLQSALDQAELNRHQKLPSVLEPAIDGVEMEPAQAINYLLSLIPTGSPRLAMSTGAKDQFLTDRAIDVAFYDPAGTYLIPVREIILGSSTTLSLLVLELQSLLDQNIDELNRMTKGKITDKYLVFSIQIRMFSDTRFLSCPKVSGELGGADAGHGAEYVQWFCNQGDMEVYWDVYRRTIQLGAAGTGMQAITKPMFKIRTVKKLPSPHDHLLGGGGHTFITDPNVVPVFKPTTAGPKRTRSPLVQKKNRIAIKHEDQLGPEDRALYDSIMEGMYGKSSVEITKADILAAVLDGLDARLSDEEAKFNAPEGDEYEIQESYLFKEYMKECHKYRKQHGTNTGEPVDRRRNWAYYQRMGGDPEVHAACDLSRHPFELEDIPPAGHYDHLHDPRSIPTREQMVPFQQIPPSVFKIRSLSPGERAKLDAWEERKERAISFDDSDNEEFFPNANGPAGSRRTEPPSLVSPTPKKPGRIDTDSILNSVHLRKNMHPSHFSGMNRPMSPSPLQNMTNARGGSGFGGSGFGPESISIGYGIPNQQQSGSGSAGYGMQGQTSGPGFYDVNFGDQDVPENWSNRVNNLQDQSGYYNANNAQNLGDLVQVDHNIGMTKAQKRRSGTRSRHNNMENSPSMQQPDTMGPNAQGVAPGDVHVNKLRANTQAHSSLSEFSSMLKGKNPSLSNLNSFNQPIASGSGSPSTPTPPAYTQRTRGTAPRSQNPHARNRVGSALRAESPAFKMNPPKRASASKLGSGLAAGMMNLQVDDTAAPSSESSASASFESK